MTKSIRHLAGAAILAASLLGAAAAAVADPGPEVCRTCAIRGSGHGPEKVAATRSHEGREYAFCSVACAEAFDAFPEGYAVHPIPRAAPRVTLTTTAGDALALGAGGEHVVLLDFWATWCAPCKKAMPELERLQDEFGPLGLAVVGVSIDEDPAALEKYLRSRPPGYAVARDSKETPAWAAYAVAAIPAMVLIDRQGRIVAEWRGKVDMKDVRAGVQAALGGGQAGTGDSR